MTLILAAKNKSEILFCYDALVVHKSRRFLAHKVRPLSNQNVAVGIAGGVRGAYDSEFDFLDSRLAGKGDVICALEETLASERVFTIKDYSTLQYIFGLRDGRELKLFASNYSGKPMLREVQCHGTGAGMYSQVEDMLMNGYHPKMTSKELRKHLSDVMALAKRINLGEQALKEQKKDDEDSDDCVLQGFGMGRLTRNGYELLEYNEK